MTVYLDNSATTKVSEPVAKAVYNALTNGFYNPSAQYKNAVTVEKSVNTVREQIKLAIKAKDAEVYFTSGGTESNNLAIFGYLSRLRDKGCVLYSAVEHPSVAEACEAANKLGFTAKKIPVLSNGKADINALSDLLAENDVKLVTVMQVNNETGAINDIKSIYTLIKSKYPNCVLHVDGVQGFLREDFDFAYCDMYTLSGHKIHAPKGIGALVVSKKLFLNAQHVGGGQERNIRSGTENTSGIIGLGEAISVMQADTDMRSRVMGLKKQLCELILNNIPDASVMGPEPKDGACHILNIAFPGVRGEVMLHALEEKDVMVSTGSACSSKKTKVSPILLAMGYSPSIAEGAVRFSLCPYTTNNEIETAAKAVYDCYELLKRYKRR